METYTRKQEVVNALIHGIGMLFGVSGLPVLVAIGTVNGNTPGIIGSGIYGFCFLMLFTSSTIYHITLEPATRRLFKTLDHISIYFLIAGTYTPLLLIFLNNQFGVTLLVVLWSLTLLGIFFKIRYTGRFEIVSTIVYLLMGWIMLAGGRRFFTAMPADVIVMICIGGGLFSVGVIFYLWDKYLYTHAVWHGFVLAGAICHYVAVLLSL
ncbi:hemolysin III family protein [Paraflavitalea sp. CAU 1676]|uniref:PAQR family membrane homeostasis protein TrhA n=1 Tax=Paraflavitalea sp. CAU 1676 TaxID=3032598 RepID=UPI0023DB5C5E|nr:hemolysin III family protein [Paraflavitalea sp. CAU 1676]MDF2191244.1 hemolysin III family protein [Paraflavitalea sp. CAU 1676]